jgi:hypothetical protein
MSIDQIAESYGAHAMRSAGMEPKKRADEKKVTAEKSAVPVSDKIHISDAAKAMKEKAGLQATAQSELNKIPDDGLSEARIQQVVARIMSQHYDSKHVLESIAQSLFNDGMQIANEQSSGIGISKLNDATANSPSSLDGIQSKVESGFYDQNEVFDIIVRELFS